jgi:hypothetical protein
LKISKSKSTVDFSASCRRTAILARTASRPALALSTVKYSAVFYNTSRRGKNHGDKAKDLVLVRHRESEGKVARRLSIASDRPARFATAPHGSQPGAGRRDGPVAERKRGIISRSSGSTSPIRPIGRQQMERRWQLCLRIDRVLHTLPRKCSEERGLIVGH